LAPKARVVYGDLNSRALPRFATANPSWADWFEIAPLRQPLQVSLNRFKGFAAKRRAFTGGPFNNEI
jgi:hypothetical protein